MSKEDEYSKETRKSSEQSDLQTRDPLASLNQHKLKVASLVANVICLGEGWLVAGGERGGRANWKWQCHVGLNRVVNNLQLEPVSHELETKGA